MKWGVVLYRSCRFEHPSPGNSFFLVNRVESPFLAYEQLVGTIFFVYRHLVTGNQVVSLAWKSKINRATGTNGKVSIPQLHHSIQQLLFLILFGQ